MTNYLSQMYNIKGDQGALLQLNIDFKIKAAIAKGEYSQNTPYKNGHFSAILSAIFCNFAE